MSASDYMEVETSSDSKAKISNVLLLGDSDKYQTKSPSVRDLDEKILEDFCKKAAVSFFEHHGLVSHQLNSYNAFLKTGIQRIFDSIGEVFVESIYDDLSRNSLQNVRRYASVKFGKVALDRPRFWAGDKFSAENGKEFLDLLPWHARLQNITYSSRLSVRIHYQAYTQELVKEDSKFGKGKGVERKILYEDTRDVLVGRVPVMVRSDLCWMKGAKKVDCDFDEGGYFLIKGSEKAIIAQEKLCMNRLWIASSPNWVIKYDLLLEEKGFT